MFQAVDVVRRGALRVQGREGVQAEGFCCAEKVFVGEEEVVSLQHKKY
jgi:hypothetical protein